MESFSFDKIDLSNHYDHSTKAECETSKQISTGLQCDSFKKVRFGSKVSIREYELEESYISEIDDTHILSDDPESSFGLPSEYLEDSNRNQSSCPPNNRLDRIVSSSKGIRSGKINEIVTDTDAILSSWLPNDDIDNDQVVCDTDAILSSWLSNCEVDQIACDEHTIPYSWIPKDERDEVSSPSQVLSSNWNSSLKESPSRWIQDDDEMYQITCSSKEIPSTSIPDSMDQIVPRRACQPYTDCNEELINISTNSISLNTLAFTHIKDTLTDSLELVSYDEFLEGVRQRASDETVESSDSSITSSPKKSSVKRHLHFDCVQVNIDQRTAFEDNTFNDVFSYIFYHVVSFAMCKLRMHLLSSFPTERGVLSQSSKVCLESESDNENLHQIKGTKSRICTRAKKEETIAKTQIFDGSFCVNKCDDECLSNKDPYGLLQNSQSADDDRKNFHCISTEEIHQFLLPEMQEPAVEPCKIHGLNLQQEILCESTNSLPIRKSVITPLLLDTIHTSDTSLAVHKSNDCKLLEFLPIQQQAMDEVLIQDVVASEVHPEVAKPVNLSLDEIICELVESQVRADTNDIECVSKLSIDIPAIKEQLPVPVFDISRKRKMEFDAVGDAQCVPDIYENSTKYPDTVDVPFSHQLFINKYLEVSKPQKIRVGMSRSRKIRSSLHPYRK